MSGKAGRAQQCIVTDGNGEGALAATLGLRSVTASHHVLLVEELTADHTTLALEGWHEVRWVPRQLP